ncbi:hypothetical protein PARPLA_02590 [Rhodobacteraceae bacterium THAF1]|uniref:hypothetical protein n=1 Tax=Palleronia sp. THAF1 TaxID=2587842 RepID=UPI000F3AFA1F|nr:hypothetical protein [Palleronia sp. THAF1]QFU08069.1 hypothetical protein FIU81_05225 [Palleronia sp. THAF1]VDC27926.1 hypothetical protein PARPLA_02590 [Rhodobacteraceae bacterium THAF1]
MFTRMTSIAALLAAGMVLAACQEEEADATETSSEVETVETTADEAGENVTAESEDMAGGDAEMTSVDDEVAPETDAMAESDSDTENTQMTSVDDEPAPETDSAAMDDAAAMDDSDATVAGEDTAEASPADENDNVAEQTEVETSDTGAASAEATEEALATARDGESPAAAAQDDAVDAAQEEGTVGAEAAETSQSEGRAILEQALTVDGFDPDALTTALENAEMNDMVRTALTNAVTNVDPENDVAVEALTNRLRSAFGMQ